MMDRNLIEIRMEGLKSGQTFPDAIGEFRVIAVPRVGELLHLDDVEETLLGNVIRVRHFAEAKSPEGDVSYVSGANILVTIEVE